VKIKDLASGKLEAPSGFEPLNKGFADLQSAVITPINSTRLRSKSASDPKSIPNKDRQYRVRVTTTLSLDTVVWASSEREAIDAGIADVRYHGFLVDLQGQAEQVRGGAA
jgi:hypothetical protein